MPSNGSVWNRLCLRRIFPPEISLDNCMEQIDEIIQRNDLKEEHKTAILGDNARRFYKI
jgi:hypothetical protein